MAPAASSASTGGPKYGVPITRLALADLIHEWQLSICGVLAVTVVLAPLLLLFGLKYGVVESLRNRLASDPINLEIKHFGEDGFDEAWFKQANELPWVGFLIPRTRFSHTSWCSRTGGLRCRTCRGEPDPHRRGRPGAGPGRSPDLEWRTGRSLEGCGGPSSRRRRRFRGGRHHAHARV